MSNSNSYYDACQPNDSGADYIADCPCQCIYLVCDGNATDIEPEDRENLQYSHQEESAVFSELSEVYIRPLNKRRSLVGIDARIPERARDKGSSYYDYHVDKKRKQGFIPEKLNWLDIVFLEDALLENKAITVHKERNNN